MTTFLLVLSLFLNIIALFAVIILFLRQNRLTQVEKKQEKMIIEMEDVIASYLVQMKEENENFLNRIKEIDVYANQSAAKKIVVDSPRIGNEVNNSLIDNNLKIRTGKIQSIKAVSAYRQNANAPNLGNPNVDQIELPPIEINQEKIENVALIKKNEINDGFQDQSFLSQVLSLQKQGFSEEKIAKRLNKGKTEIALLLKFNQNQQE